MRILVGHTWRNAAIEKFQGGRLVAGMTKTLADLASQNPYGLEKAFLTNLAIPKPTRCGTLSMYGDLLVGLALLLGILSEVGALAGLLMSLDLSLAALWTGAGTETWKLVVVGVPVIRRLWGAGKVLSVEQALSDRLPQRPGWPRQLTQLPEAASLRNASSPSFRKIGIAIKSYTDFLFY